MALPVLAFDQKPGSFDAFRFAPDKYIDLSDSVVAVTTFGTGLGMLPDVVVKGKQTYKAYQGFFTQQGSGAVIEAPNGNIYILTVAHVLIPNTLQITTGTYSTVNTFCLKVLTQWVYVGSWTEATRIKCEIVYISVETDTVILKPMYTNAYLKPIPYNMVGFGMQRYLHEGDSVAVVTGYRDKDPKKEFPLLGEFPAREWYYEARYGKVIAPNPKTFDTKQLPWFNINDITTDVKIYPGDSGSPMFIFIDGKPILVGLARAVSHNYDPFTYECMGYYSYFTYLDEVVLRYLHTKGID